MASFGGSEDRDAEQRREDHRDEPGHDQRDADDGEEREGVFAGRAGREADRHEAGDRDQRAGEHGHGVVCEGEGRRLLLVVAGGQPRDHGVGRGHRVVDQQRERDDQRAERDALHVDARQSSMIGKTMASVSGMDSATTRPGRTPRLMKLTTRMIATACQSDVMNSRDGVVDRDGLVGDQLRLDADGQVGGDRRHRRLDVRAQRQDVAARRAWRCQARSPAGR